MKNLNLCHLYATCKYEIIHECQSDYEILSFKICLQDKVLHLAHPGLAFIEGSSSLDSFPKPPLT